MPPQSEPSHPSTWPQTHPPDGAPTPPAPPTTDREPLSPATLPESGSPDALPRRAGRYELLEEIARGGMGIVLRAHDPDCNRTLAVKVMLALHRDRPDLTRRFLEEAQVTSQLQHPG